MSAGEAYATLIEEQLAEKRDRKRSLEQRATGVVASASAVVGILLGLSAVAHGSGKFTLPPGARAFLVWALVLFILTGSLAIATVWPRRYDEPTCDGLRKLVTPEAWSGAADEALRWAALARVDVICSARRKNGQKAIFLVGAMVGELGAVALLAGGIWMILTRS